MISEVIFDNQQETDSFSQIIGKNLKGGECIEFVSDLGGGKTTFVRGIVAGSGSTDSVGSPTFTISKHYTSQHVNFYHYDFYRLSEPGLVSEELKESIDDEKGVSLIEWGKTVEDVLPKDRVVIEIDKIADNHEGRKCTINYPEIMSYLLEGAV